MTLNEMIADATTATGRKGDTQKWVQHETDGTLTLWLVTCERGNYVRSPERRMKSYARHHGQKVVNLKADTGDNYWVVTVKRAANDTTED